jgi:hypothetical protein
MDREQFDALTRCVSARGSRRLAFAGLFGATVLSRLPQATEARCRGKKGKNKRQCRRRSRDNGRGIDIVCQDKLFGLCTYIPGVNGNPCCNGMTCFPTINPIVTACQFPCQSDDDCARKFPRKALTCRADLLVCPGTNEKCCLPR